MLSKFTAKLFKKEWIFLSVIIIFFLLNLSFGWTSKFTAEASLVYMRSYIDDHFILSALLYIVLTSIGSVVIALPGVAFAIIAGLLFGPWLGSLLCLIASSLGAVMSFLAGRYFLQDSLREKIMAHEQLSKILFIEKPQNDIIVLMITRLVPIFPFNLQNFAYGITNISLRKYTIATVIFTAPGVVLFTLMTAGIIDETVRQTALIVSSIILVLLVLLTLKAKNHYQEVSSQNG